MDSDDIDIDLRLAWLFMRELQVQSGLAARAFVDLSRIQLQVLSSDAQYHPQVYAGQPEALNGRAFLLAHSFLTHVANVSKILWPPELGFGRRARSHPLTQPERGERANALRRVLGVQESSRLRVRSIRDSLEHFDERLETWCLKGAGRNLDMIDMNRSAFGFSSTDLPPIGDISLRNLQWQPLTFTFLGENVNLEKMADELVPLHEAARSWQNTASTAGIKKRPEESLTRQTPSQEDESTERPRPSVLRVTASGSWKLL